MPESLDMLGMGTNVVFSILQMLKSGENEQWTRKQREEYGGILDDYFGKAEGYMGEGYEKTQAGIGAAYGSYGRQGQAITDMTLGLSGRNYTDLQNMLGTDRYASLAGWEGRETGLLSGYDDRTAGLRGGYGARTGDITGRYGERLDTAMGMMGGWGEAERAALGRDYRELGESQQAKLIRGGMGGTTIGANLAAGNLREKQYEKGLLNARLTREQLGAYHDFSGEGLLARERLTGEGLLAGERLTGDRLMAGERISGQTQGMQDYWANYMTKTAAARGFAEQDIRVAGMGAQADIGLQGDLAGVDLGSQYYGNMANLQMSYPSMWGNFMTQNPVEFMDFSPGINLSGSIMSYSQMLDQQRAAEKAGGGGLNPAGGVSGALGGAAAGGMFFGPIGAGVGAGLGGAAGLFS